LSAINLHLIKRLTDPGPKRILSLDGGGIRGALTLGSLEKMEQLLAERHKDIIPKEKFRLHHYFDLIGGTSTGAIIAGALMIGKSVKEIKEIYKQLGKDIFSGRKYKRISINLGFWKKTFRFYTKYMYDSAPMQKHLEEVFGNSLLGDESNKTGLCIVAKRFDTFSTWPVTNNPNACYFSVNRFPLKVILRASTAAPTFFKPEVLDVGDGQQSSFVDGGMSLMNNPALQLFLISAVKGYNIGGAQITWPQGEDKLFIVSVGTGRKTKILDAKKWADPNLIQLLPEVAEQFLNDANELVEAMMQLMGKCPEGHQYRAVDTEMGTLENDMIHQSKHFTYVRYNTELTRNELDKLGFHGWDDPTIESLIEMDMPDNVDRLLEVGEKAADKIVATNFPAAFDIQTVYDPDIQKRENVL
jgi:uncharacterized protein